MECSDVNFYTLHHRLVALSISLIGQRESIHSYFRALADIPQPDDKNVCSDFREYQFIIPISSCHLVLSINSLASMFCGIFLIWTVMLPSKRTTEMVIKTISGLKRILIKLILIKEELEKACPGVVTCADIVQRWRYAGLFLILNLPTLSLF